MFTTADIARLRSLVESHLHIALPENLSITQESGLNIHFEGCTAQIAAEDRNALTRGLFLLGCAIKDGS